jgi:hypothetical protein
MNGNFIKYLKNLFLIFIPRKIAIFLAIIKIFSKIECRFISNKEQFQSYKKKNFFIKFFSYYKDVKYVKSSLFEISKKEKLSEDYIVLLDFYPYYREAIRHTILKQSDVEDHYKKMLKLLNVLKNIYNKQIVVPIHPEYPKEFYMKHLPNLKIFKYRTIEFINKAFIVIFMNTSSIIHAILKNKKILLYKSDLFKNREKNFIANHYKDILGAKTIQLSDSYKINKKKFIFDLEKRVDNYFKYKDNYFGFNLKKNSSQDIYNFIKKKYLQ